MTNQIKCFFIDDDEEDATLFSIMMKEVNKDALLITAINGSFALQKLNADQTFIPDFIFLDLNMPVMGGKECLRELKKIPRLEAVPIIIYSTSDNDNDMQETKQAGAAHYVIKPFDPENLGIILQKLFQKEDLPFLIREPVK